MGKQLVFIDDSGDPGFKPVSSSNFVLAAAVFIDPEAVFSLSARISEYRRSLGWRDDYEFKDSVDDNLIQLADVIADSIHRYVNANKTDYATYMNIIKRKIVQLKRIDQR